MEQLMNEHASSNLRLGHSHGKMMIGLDNHLEPGVCLHCLGPCARHASPLALVQLLAAAVKCEMSSHRMAETVSWLSFCTYHKKSNKRAAAPHTP